MSYQDSEATRMTKGDYANTLATLLSLDHFMIAGLAKLDIATLHKMYTHYCDGAKHHGFQTEELTKLRNENRTLKSRISALERKVHKPHKNQYKG